MSEKRSCQGKNIAKFNEQNAQFGQKHMQECFGSGSNICAWRIENRIMTALLHQGSKAFSRLASGPNIQ